MDLTGRDAAVDVPAKHAPTTDVPPDAHREPTTPALRLPGPDVVRALAMAGVVTMNFHGYLVIMGGRQEGGWVYDLFDPWTGPLSTRFAATFVLTAGVGATLLTRSSIGDPRRTTEMRWRLVRRGLALYAFGLAFDFIWPGTILPYYGAMFAVAALLFTLRSRWVVTVGAAAALSGWLINWWIYERELDGHDTLWLTSPGGRSPRGLVFDLWVNGTHPLFPWLAFFCAGIVLGRALDRPGWRLPSAAAGFVLITAGTIADASATTGRALVLLSSDPFDRGVAYTASALGTALLAFVAISWVADRYDATAVIRALRAAGQMSLSIYIAHALVFNLLTSDDWLGVVEPGGIATSLTLAAIVWLTATSAAVAYHRRTGRGPAERIYRRITA